MSDVPQKVTGWPAKVKEYFEELKLEMKHVTWPSWKQVRATTGVVIASVLAFSAYFLVVDTVIGSAVTKIFNTFGK